MLQNTMDYMNSIRNENETSEELVERVINDPVYMSIIASLTPNINCTALKALLRDPEFIKKL